MALIIPWQIYQYDQYAERLIIRPYDPYRFRPVTKVSAAVNLPKDRPPDTKGTFYHKLTDTQQSEKRKIADRIYSELTGKGRYIDQRV